MDSITFLSNQGSVRICNQYLCIQRRSQSGDTWGQLILWANRLLYCFQCLVILCTDTVDTVMGESWAGELHDWWFSLVVYVVENGFCCYYAVLILWGNIDVGYICTIILNTVHVVVIGDDNTRRRCCGRRYDVWGVAQPTWYIESNSRHAFVQKVVWRKSLGLQRTLGTISNLQRNQ